MIKILNSLHKKGFYPLLCFICQCMYFIRGKGIVKMRYRPDFRAYEFRVSGITLLSIGPGWAYTIDYLRELLRDTYAFHYMPKAGDCVVDIGSGLGEETVVYGVSVGAQGKVHALEANPVTFKGLEYMCSQNGFSWVSPHNVAIFNRDGEVTIEDDKNNYLTNTINAGSGQVTSLQVKATTLDSLVRQSGITRIDFLKSNIEGAEQFLIEGMSESLPTIRHICISCHDFRHVYHRNGEFYLTKSKVRTFLERHGFEIMTRATGNHAIDDCIYARNPRA